MKCLCNLIKCSSSPVQKSHSLQYLAHRFAQYVKCKIDYQVKNGSMSSHVVCKIYAYFRVRRCFFSCFATEIDPKAFVLRYDLMKRTQKVTINYHTIWSELNDQRWPKWQTFLNTHHSFLTSVISHWIYVKSVGVHRDIHLNSLSFSHSPFDLLHKYSQNVNIMWIVWSFFSQNRHMEISNSDKKKLIKSTEIKTQTHWKQSFDVYFKLGIWYRFFLQPAFKYIRLWCSSHFAYSYIRLSHFA